MVGGMLIYITSFGLHVPFSVSRLNWQDMGLGGGTVRENHDRRYNETVRKARVGDHRRVHRRGRNLVGTNLERLLATLRCRFLLLDV